MTLTDYPGTSVEEVKDANKWYQIFKGTFKNLPEEIQKHRKYFLDKGFGEDAFHAMWYYLFDTYRPKNVLEIGVFRGQTISLFNLLGKTFNYSPYVLGISPLTDANDSVSTYDKLDYAKDIATHYEYFNLGTPNLLKEYSEKKIARETIKSKKWDLIYIDGNHDWPNVLVDYCNCAEALSDAGIIVFDDSSLHENYDPPPNAFKGHPGPSYVLEAYAKQEMDLFLTVGHNNCLRRV